MTSEHWIFISPHFDDVVLSCGGLVYTLANQGMPVEIWTIMGGFPPDENYSEFAIQTHHAWGMAGEAAIHMRRGEDRAACDVLSAQPRHLHWPDAIYRYDPQTGAPLVNNNDEIFGRPPEKHLVDQIMEMLSEEIPAGAYVVSPMGLGNHIDHQAVVQALEAFPHTIYSYADYPYILKDFSHPALREERFVKFPINIDEEALIAWQDAVLCYASQLGSFWRDEDETRLALRNYLAGGGGGLWKKK